MYTWNHLGGGWETGRTEGRGHQDIRSWQKGKNGVEIAADMRSLPCTRVSVCVSAGVFVRPVPMDQLWHFDGNCGIRAAENTLLAIILARTQYVTQSDARNETAFSG